MPLSLTSPEAAVAATPYLIGFRPEDSAVILLCDHSDLRASVRIDLPPMPDLDWLLTVLDGLGDPVPDSVVLLFYADRTPRYVAVDLAHWLCSVLSPLVDLMDCVIVHEGTVQSLRGALQGGAEEIALASLSNHPVVAACVAEGMAYLDSREQLEAQLDFVDDEFSQQVERLVDAIELEPYEQWRDDAEERALSLVVGMEPLSAADVLLLGRACRDIHVRDPLLALLLTDTGERSRIHQARSRLTFAATHLPDRFAGPVAATTALLCWALGDWAASHVAAHRATQADPRNSLAPLVLDALERGLPGDTWAALTRDIPMDVLRGRRPRSA